MMWRLLKEAAGLDILDLNYSYSSEKLGLLKDLPGEELPRKGLLIRIVSFSLHLLWALVCPKRKLKRRPVRPVVFFASSLNQRDSISPVAGHVRDSVLVCTHIRPGARLDCDEDYSLARAYLLSLPFLPLVIKEFWRSRGYSRKSFFFWFDEYWLSYGHYLSARLWLRKVAPRAVVTANDHTMIPRTFASAAKGEGIPTIYLQHAACSTKHPPLTFDYALLDGRDTLGKYDITGPSGAKVFLIGKPRFDANYRDVNDSRKAQAIGICTNGIDPIVRVEQLCDRLRQELAMLDFTIRPHPGDSRKVWGDLAKRYSMALSDWRVESPFEFLKSMDVIIAGDSSIHVEAALMNTYPLFFDFSEKRWDPYDFQRAGLIDYVSDVDEISSRVLQLSQHKPNVRSKAKPFVATVDTPFDGHSGELGASLVDHIVSGSEVGGEGWERISGVQLEAYELAETSSPDGN
jgi:hypothetical protein